MEEKQFISHLPRASVLTLKDQISYQEGQIASKTLAQNKNVSLTLFAFDKDEEISSHPVSYTHLTLPTNSLV